jgi:hypothetical protein
MRAALPTETCGTREMARGHRSVKREALGGITQRGFTTLRTIEAMGRDQAMSITVPACPLRRIKVSRDARAGRCTPTVVRMGISTSKTERAAPCPLRQVKEPATRFLRLHTASTARTLTFLVTREAAADATSRTTSHAGILTRATQGGTKLTSLDRGIPCSTATTRTGATIDDLEMSIEIAIATRDYIRLIDEMNGRGSRGARGAGVLRAEAAGAPAMGATATERGTDEKVETTGGKKRRRRRKPRAARKAAACQESVPSA